MERVERQSQRTPSRGAAETTASRAAPIADFRPAAAAQRALVQAAGLESAAPAQLAGPEDELQMKADPAQLAGPEEELQMKSDPLQRAAEEEPEPQL